MNEKEHKQYFEDRIVYLTRMLSHFTEISTFADDADKMLFGILSSRYKVEIESCNEKLNDIEVKDG